MAQSDWYSGQLSGYGNSMDTALQVFSDLHTEFDDSCPPCVGDVIIAAGDIGTGVNGLNALALAAGGRPVIMVAGNHEFYGHSYPSLIDKLRAAAARHSNFFFLERDELVIRGVRFLGCTLWTDFALYGDDNIGACALSALRNMNDYTSIRNSENNYGPLFPSATRQDCLRSRAWLADRLAEKFSGPTIVVTHHPPLTDCQAEHHRNKQEALSAAFVNDWSGWVAKCGAAIWVCGHTHYCCDVMVGDTRVVSNQRGYPWEKLGWEPQKLITVSAPTARERMETVLCNLSLTVTQAARILNVTRQVIYACLRDAKQKPERADDVTMQSRFIKIYDFAMQWEKFGHGPIGDYKTLTLDDGRSLLDYMVDDELDDIALSKIRNRLAALASIFDTNNGFCKLGFAENPPENRDIED